MHNPVPTVIRPLLLFARSARLIAPLIVAVAFVAGITTACSSATASSPSHATGRARSAGGPLPGCTWIEIPPLDVGSGKLGTPWDRMQAEKASGPPPECARPVA